MKQPFNDIVMMVLVRDEVRLCQVKAYHTNLTVVSLCMAANEINRLYARLNGMQLTSNTELDKQRMRLITRKCTQT